MNTRDPGASWGRSGVIDQRPLEGKVDPNIRFINNIYYLPTTGTYFMWAFDDKTPNFTDAQWQAIYDKTGAIFRGVPANPHGKGIRRMMYSRLPSPMVADPVRKEAAHSFVMPQSVSTIEPE